MNVMYSRLQIIMVLLLSIGTSNHLIVLPLLLKSAGRDAWFSIIIGYCALIIWCLILYFILKSMKNTPIKKWIEERIGRVGYWLISGGIVLYLLATGMLLVYKILQNISIFFLPDTSTYIVILSFMFISYQAANKGFRTVVYMSAVLIFFVLFLELAVYFATLGNKDFQLLLPLLTDGVASGVNGMEIILGGSIDLLFILLLQHKVSKPFNYGSIIILLTLLTILLLAPTIASITSFGPYFAGTLRFPAFEQWRLVSIGKYISHIDFLAVFQLMSGGVVRMALILYLLSKLVIGESKKLRKPVMICSAIVISLPSLFVVSDIKMDEYIGKGFYTYSLWFWVVLTIVLFAIRYIPSRKEKTS